MKKCFLLVVALCFSLPTLSSMECYEEPEDSALTDNVDGYDKREFVKSEFERTQDAKKDLDACAMQLVFQPPHKIFEVCGCKQAIKSMCKVEKKLGKYIMKPKNGANMAQCLPFLPILIAQ